MRKEILFSLPFLYLWEIMKPWKWICPIFHLSPILASWPAIFLLSPFDHAKHAKIQFAKNCTIFFSWQNPQYKEYFIVDFFLWWTRLNFSQVFNKRSDIVYKKIIEIKLKWSWIECTNCIVVALLALIMVSLIDLTFLLKGSPGFAWPPLEEFWQVYFNIVAF